jgi:hypothetical protein
MRHLLLAHQREADNGEASCGADGVDRAPLHGEVGGRPGDRDRESDEGQVHVPIRMCLLAYLDEAEHRDQHAREPEPADSDVGSLAVAHQGQPRAARQDHGAARNGCRTGPPWREGVEGGQPDGPERLAQIDGVGPDRVLQALAEAELRCVLHRARVFLHEVGDDRGDSDQHDHRPFLTHR